MTMATTSNVTVCSHPLVQHHLVTLRDKKTSNDAFRAAMHRIGRLIFHEATHHLPLSKTLVETPLCKTEGEILSPEVPVLIAPILRAALMLGDVAMDVLPTASVYHIGLYRDEETFKPVTYYNKLPASLKYDKARLFILDPMLATGGSAIAAVDIMLELGVKPDNISFICVIAAPEGIQALSEKHPGIHIYTGSVDDKLNENKYIVPGLGDAGDRAFGTSH